VTEQGTKIMLEGELDLDDPTAQKAYRKMRQKLVKGLSIGFIAIKRKFDEEAGRYIRRIQELKLMEVSVVTFPMLPSAQITSVKQRDDAAAERAAELAAQKAAERVADLVKPIEERLSALEAKATAPPPAAPTPTPEPVQDHSAISLALARLRLSLPQ
jgi:hypothetical protein